MHCHDPLDNLSQPRLESIYSIQRMKHWHSMSSYIYIDVMWLFIPIHHDPCGDGWCRRDITVVHKNVWVGWILYVYTQIAQPSNIFVWINHCDTVKTARHRHVASKEGRALLKRIITCIRPRQSQPLPWVHAPTKTRDGMSHIKN